MCPTIPSDILLILMYPFSFSIATVADDLPPDAQIIAASIFLLSPKTSNNSEIYSFLKQLDGTYNTFSSIGKKYEEIFHQQCTIHL